VCTTKYKKLDPEDPDYNIKPKQGEFPVTDFYDDMPPSDKDLLWVKVFAFTKHIIDKRDVNDSTPLSITPVGLLFAKAASLVERNHQVSLAVAYELKSKQAGNENRCMGQIALRLHSEYFFSDTDKRRILRNISQDIIIGERFKQVELDDLPEWTKVFRYEINAVQYPYQMTFALVNGPGGEWWDQFDNRGLSRVMEEIYNNFPADEEHDGLPASLSTEHKRASSLGALIYRTTQIKFGKQAGKALSLAYACSRNGFQAAVDLCNATRGRTLYIFGQIPVTIECFPPRFTIGRQISGKRQSKDGVLVFARNTIEANNQHCTTNFKTIMMENLTEDVFDPRSIINMTHHCDNLIGVIPRCTKATNENSNTDAIYSGLLILRKSAETMTRTPQYFKNIFQVYVPSIFPIAIDDDEDEDDGFKPVQYKQKLQPKSNTKPQSMQDILRNLDTSLNAHQDGDGKFIVVRFGRGALRALGVYTKYDQVYVGARYFVEGISGGSCKSFKNENDAWKELSKYIPHVDSYETLQLFRRFLPHTMTNLDPMYPEYGGKIFHKHGAPAFSCIECDDTDLLAARKEATLTITGSPNGKCDKRCYYDAIMANWEAFVQEYRQHQKGNTEQAANDDDEEGSNNSANENEEDYNNFGSSQDAFNNYDDNEGDGDENNQDQGAGSPKKRKVDSTGSKGSAMDWNGTDTQRTYQVYFIGVSQPDIGTLHDTLDYLSGFKPGFGAWFEGQTKLAQFRHFPGCITAVIACPVNLVRSLRLYVYKTPYLGKYKVFAAPIVKPSHIQELPLNQHLEVMAAHTLIKYVKTYNHPKHDADIKQLLLEASKPQQVYEYFLKNKAMQQDILTEDGKVLNDGYRVPGPETTFKPYDFEPVPAEQEVHMEDNVFSGTTGNF
jgi:hypothetical protein